IQRVLSQHTTSRSWHGYPNRLVWKWSQRNYPPIHGIKIYLHQTHFEPLEGFDPSKSSTPTKPTWWWGNMVILLIFSELLRVIPGLPQLVYQWLWRVNVLVGQVYLLISFHDMRQHRIICGYCNSISTATHPNGSWMLTKSLNSFDRV